jgi:hypothetical protein
MSPSRSQEAHVASHLRKSCILYITCTIDETRRNQNENKVTMTITTTKIAEKTLERDSLHATKELLMNLEPDLKKHEK